ncbi:hypothetical protein D3C71_1458010 [compost metagenome]
MDHLKTATGGQHLVAHLAHDCAGFRELITRVYVVDRQLRPVFPQQVQRCGGVPPTGELQAYTVMTIECLLDRVREHAQAQNARFHARHDGVGLILGDKRMELRHLRLQEIGTFHGKTSQARGLGHLLSRSDVRPDAAPKQAICAAICWLMQENRASIPQDPAAFGQHAGPVTTMAGRIVEHHDIRAGIRQRHVTVVGVDLFHALGAQIQLRA